MVITMDKIVDLHTHILPGVDDGAQTIEESLEIIEFLSKRGIKDIVLTSHYIKNTKYNIDENDRKNILKELEKRLNHEEIHLYLGNEVYLCEDIMELLKNHEIITINNTQYMLVELPLTGYLNQLPNILCELTSQGIVPIIAHPERYQFLQKHNQRICELLEFNCLLQCNIDSLIGKYGNHAKKLMKWLLKKNLVQLVATDTHSVGKDKDLDQSFKKLKKIVGKERFIELTNTNPTKILQGEKVVGNLEYLIEEERNRN